jgi:hypothetical protein
MRFRLDDSEFRIVFKREHKDVTYLKQKVDEDGRPIFDIFANPLFEKVQAKSKFPSTTVTIFRDRDNAIPGEVFRTATVACHHRESYSPEQGRLNALRLVSKTLDKEFKTLLWETYMGEKTRQRAESRKQLLEKKS